MEKLTFARFTMEFDYSNLSEEELQKAFEKDLNRVFANLLWLLDSHHSNDQEETFKHIDMQIVEYNERIAMSVTEPAPMDEADAYGLAESILEHFALNPNIDFSGPVQTFITAEDPYFRLIRNVFRSFLKIESHFFQLILDEDDKNSFQHKVFAIRQDLAHSQFFTASYNRFKNQSKSDVNLGRTSNRDEQAGPTNRTRNEFIHENPALPSIQENKDIVHENAENHVIHVANQEVQKLITLELQKMALVKKKCDAFVKLISTKHSLGKDKSKELIQIFGKEIYEKHLIEYGKPNGAEINIKAATPFIYLIKSFSFYLQEKIYMLETTSELYTEINKFNKNNLKRKEEIEFITNCQNNIKVLSKNIMTFAQHHFFSDDMLKNFLIKIQDFNEFPENVPEIWPNLRRDSDVGWTEQYIPTSCREVLLKIEHCLTHSLVIKPIADNFSARKTRLLGMYRNYPNSSHKEITTLEDQLRQLCKKAAKSIVDSAQENQNDTSPKLSEQDIRAALLTSDMGFAEKSHSEPMITPTEDGLKHTIETTTYPFGREFFHFPNSVNTVKKKKTSKPSDDHTKGDNNSSTDSTQNSIDFPEEKTSDSEALETRKQYKRTPQTYEEYLKNYQEERIEIARKKHKRAFKELLDQQGKQFLTHGHFLKSDEIDIHQPLTMAMLTQETLSLFKVMSSNQPKAQIIQFPQFSQFTQRNYAKVSGGYTGQTGYTNSSGNNQSKTGKLLELSNYQSKPQSTFQKTKSFVTSKNLTGFERGAYGVAGAYHLIKTGYYAEKYIHALILNARGQKSHLTNEQAIEGLTTIGFWIAFWTGVSKISLRFAGAAGVAFMVKDFISYGQEKIKNILMSYYGLKAQEKLTSTDPKLTKIYMLDKAIRSFNVSPTEDNRLKMIMAFNHFVAPAMPQVKPMIQIDNYKFISVPVSTYSLEQEHYTHQGEVISLPKIYASKFVKNDKMLPKKNIQFASIIIQDSDKKTQFMKSYTGPEGELYKSYSEHVLAWSQYGQEASEFIDTAKTANHLDAVQAEQLNYHLVLNKQTQTVKVMSADLSFEMAKLIEENGILKLVTIGDMHEFQPVKLDRFVQILKSNEIKPEPLVIRSKPYLMQKAFKRQHGEALLPKMKTVAKILYEQKMLDREFYDSVENTKANEGYKNIILLNLLAQKGQHLLNSSNKYNLDKKDALLFAHQYSKIVLANKKFEQIDYSNFKLGKPWLPKEMGKYDKLFSQ